MKEETNNATYIKESRKKLELTQTALGEKLGVGLKAVQSWEYGERNPSKTVLMMLKMLLGKK